MPETDRLRVDRKFVSRLLLGALSEHEQRLLVSRLLLQDQQLRQQVLSIVGSFESFDSDLMERYSEGLEQGRKDRELRQELLDIGRARAPRLEQLLREFTFGDVLSLGPTTRQIFSWSMAELLLQRAGRYRNEDPRQQTDLYLALMVVDVLDILGAAGERLHLPLVIDDLRRRIRRASAGDVPRQAAPPMS